MFWDPSGKGNRLKSGWGGLSKSFSARLRWAAARGLSMTRASRYFSFLVNPMASAASIVLISETHAKGSQMPEPTLRFPVTCPACALESLSEMPIAVIANALLTGKGIRLHSKCHNHYWTATFVEREELRKSLALLQIESPKHQVGPHATRFDAVG
jgi:hypothetical protein